MENEEKSLERAPLIIALIVLFGVIAVVVGLSFVSPVWWINRAHAPTNETVNDQNSAISFQEYRNDKLGVSFRYPKSWGGLEMFSEKGCFYEGPQNEPKCENVVLKFSANKEVEITSAGRLFVQYPNPREGLASDTFFIKNLVDIETYCAGKDTSRCTVYKNPQGITLAKHVVPEHCNDLNGCMPAMTYYYLKLNNIDYPGMSIAIQAKQEEAVDALTDSLKFE